jgi:transposase
MYLLDTMARREELSDEQLVLSESQISKHKVYEDGRGRPRCNDRDILNGIFWILRSGVRWCYFVE